MVKHKPPSRVRYEKEHPQVSFRIAKHLKGVVDKARGNESYPAFIKRILEKNAEEVNEIAVKNAYKKGYADAEKKYKIQYPCSVCEEPMTILPWGKVHSHIKEFLKEEGWRHTSCRGED